MRYETAVRRLRTIAEDCDKWRSVLEADETILVAVYAYGPILDDPGADLDAVDIALVLDLPADNLPWGVEPRVRLPLSGPSRSGWPNPVPRRKRNSSRWNWRPPPRICGTCATDTGMISAGGGSTGVTAAVPRIISGTLWTVTSTCSMAGGGTRALRDLVRGRAAEPVRGLSASEPATNSGLS